MIEYGFERKASNALDPAYACKVRLLGVSDLSLRVLLSDLVDLGSCDDLVFSELLLVSSLVRSVIMQVT